jgi:predicted nucleic acid-binding protein
MKGGADLRYVLDASVAVSWCFHDEQDERADAALKLLHAGAAPISPLHWWFEIRNVIMLGVRRKRVAQDETSAFFLRLEDTPIGLADLPRAEAVFAVATRHSLTFYDAAYLELAMRERIALATLDQALARAATAEGVSLIGA